VQKFHKIAQFTGLLFLIAMLWLAHSLLTLTLIDPENHNAEYIPNDATRVYRVDGNTFTRKTLTTLLLHEDEELSGLMQDLIPEKSDGSLKPLGISFSTDLIQFEIKKGNDILSGILFNLNSPHYFKKNMPLYLEDDVAIATNENVGLLLTQNGTKLSKKELQLKAKTILQNKTQFAKNHNLKATESIVSVWNRSNDGNTISLALDLKDQDLQLTGGFTTKNQMRYMTSTLVPKGFHVTSHYIPDFANDSLQKYADQMGVSLPNIRGISINYFGTKLITEPTLFPAPKADVYLEFEEDFDLKNSLPLPFLMLLKNTTAKNVLKLELNGQSYWIDQKTPRSLLISWNRSPKMEKVANAPVLLIDGAPKFLFELEGDGLVKRLIEMSPMMSSSKSAAGGIARVHLAVAQKTPSNFKIDGLVTFKKDEWPINTFFKFLIRSKLFS